MHNAPTVSHHLEDTVPTHPCTQLLSDLPSWPPLPSRIPAIRSSMCSLRPYTSSVVPPVQSTTSLLQWWRQPPQLGSGLLLPLPSQAIAFTTCLPHSAALLSVCFSSWSHFKLLKKKKKKLPSPSRWHLSAPAAVSVDAEQCHTQLRHLSYLAKMRLPLPLSLFCLFFFQIVEKVIWPFILSQELCFFLKVSDSPFTYTIMFKVRLSPIPGAGKCIYLIKLIFP